MTRKELRARRSAIIGELTRMSRGGWINASAAEYQPLGRELDAIEAQLRKPRRYDRRSADRIDGYDRDDLGESPDY